MAIEFRKTEVAGHMPEIWRGECKMLPGGFKPEQTFAAGTVLPRGTMLRVDFEKLTAVVCKVAKVLAVNSKEVRVQKGTGFVVGDTISKIGGDANVKINAIDMSAPTYDVLTLATAISGLTTGDGLTESTTAGKPKYTPNAILGAVAEFTDRGLPTLDAAYEAVVLYPSVAYPQVAEWMQGIALKENPNIVVIRQ